MGRITKSDQIRELPQKKGSFLPKVQTDVVNLLLIYNYYKEAVEKENKN